MTAEIIVCRCCGQRGQRRTNGWRRTCYDRWIRAGRPESGPPVPMPRSECARLGGLAAGGGRPWPLRAERLDDFAMVLATRTRPDEPLYQRIAVAAEAVSVSERTGWRYWADLQQQKREVSR